MSRSKPLNVNNPQSETAAMVSAILDRIVAEIDDNRTLSGERSGLRIAFNIVRSEADKRGIKYD